MDDMCRQIQRPTALRLLELLDRYEVSASSLVTGWTDEAYTDASALFTALQAEAAELVGIQIAWIEVLISRFQFAHALWSVRNGTGTDEELHAAAQLHFRGVSRLARKCRAAYFTLQ